MTAAPRSVDGLPGGIDGSVLVIGTGLIGTSVALSLRRAGVDVAALRRRRRSTSPSPRRRAPAASSRTPTCPSSSSWPCRRAARRRSWPPPPSGGPEATLTDVTSVKERVILEAVAAGADPVRLVGGHPMAGREVSGAAGARADLLDDRLWVVTPLDASGIDHVRRVHRLVSACGALPVEMGLAEHDAAVALVSHTPQVLSSVLAGQLVDVRPRPRADRRAGPARHDPHRGLQRRRCGRTSSPPTPVRSPTSSTASSRTCSARWRRCGASSSRTRRSAAPRPWPACCATGVEGQSANPGQARCGAVGVPRDQRHRGRPSRRARPAVRRRRRGRRQPRGHPDRARASVARAAWWRCSSVPRRGSGSSRRSGATRLRRARLGAAAPTQ